MQSDEWHATQAGARIHLLARAPSPRREPAADAGALLRVGRECGSGMQLQGSQQAGEATSEGDGGVCEGSEGGGQGGAEVQEVCSMGREDGGNVGVDDGEPSGAASVQAFCSGGSVGAEGGEEGGSGSMSRPWDETADSAHRRSKFFYWPVLRVSSSLIECTKRIQDLTVKKKVIPGSTHQRASTPIQNCAKKKLSDFNSENANRLDVPKSGPNPVSDQKVGFSQN